MKAGYIQTSPVFGEVEKNVDLTVRRLTRMDAELVVLPELFSTGYQFKSRKEALSLAEELTGYSVRRLSEVCSAKKMHIVAGIAERAGKEVYNSAVLIGPRGLKAVYRKAHLFWNEKKIFTPGDTPFTVHKAGSVKVGMMICFDWVFPEAARTLALKGADIICHPSNLVLAHCPESMKTRSIENRVFTVTANRVGTEERIKGTPLTFIGKSQITSPSGELLSRAPSGRGSSGTAEIDPGLSRSKRITPFNDLFKDRRREFFEL